MPLTANSLVMIYWFTHLFLATIPPAPLPDSSLFLFPQSTALLPTLLPLPLTPPLLSSSLGHRGLVITEPRLLQYILCTRPWPGSTTIFLTRKIIFFSKNFARIYWYYHQSTNATTMARVQHWKVMKPYLLEVSYQNPLPQPPKKYWKMFRHKNNVYETLPQVICN